MTNLPHNNQPTELPQQSLAKAGFSAADLAAVVAAMPGAWLLLAAHAPHFTMLAASDEYLAATMTTRAATLGRPLFEVFPDANPENPEPSGVDNLRTSLETVLHTRLPHHMAVQRYDLHRADGTWEERYWAPLNVPVPGADGEMRFLLHHVQDVTQAVLGHQALARAEQRAARILEQMADAHFVLDREFRFVTLNPAAERLVGKPREEMLGRSHWDMFPASVNMDVGHAYRRVVAEGVEQHLRTHYVGDGYDLHLEIDAYPTEEGGAAIFTRDVTERVREAEARRKGQVQRFVTQLGDALRSLGDAQAIQSEAARLLGAHLDASHVVYSETAHTSADDYGPYVAEQLRTRQTLVLADVQELPAQQGPNRALHGQVCMRAHLIAPIVKDGHLTACLAVGHAAPRHWTADEVELVEEVAERTWAAVQRARAEEALRQSEERYRTLFERMDEGFCTIEVLFDDAGRPVDYRFESVNTAFAWQTGIHGAVGRRMREISPTHEEHWFQAYGRVALTGQSIRFEAQAEALHRHFEAHAFRIGQPEERRVAILFNEITRRKQAESGLQALNAALEQRVQQRTVELAAARDAAEAASEAKDRFLATMSHELRTPLNGILGFAQLLESRLEREDDRRFAAHIRQAGQSLLRILNDVLDLAKIEAGHLELEQLPFRIESVVQACQELFAPLAVAKGIGFEVSLPARRTPELLGDAARLQQVLANLLSNAIKFTQAGGVSLVVEIHDAGDGASLVRLRVSDTGIGLTPGQQQHLFAPFQQAEASTARCYGGTGLGLWICRSLVQAMQGEITMESAPGRGTTARLAIAFTRAGQGLAAPAGEASEPGPVRALRVLVVDDIAVNREMLRALLQHHGHVVEEADNGETAAERAAAGGLDLVLIDVEMPGLDGLQATRRIRGLPGPAGRVPVWVVTGHAYDHDVAQARAAGANGHLSKPVSFQALRQVLQALQQGGDTGQDTVDTAGPP